LKTESESTTIVMDFVTLNQVCVYLCMCSFVCIPYCFSAWITCSIMD